jgi:hypothetical protein
MDMVTVRNAVLFKNVEFPIVTNEVGMEMDENETQFRNASSPIAVKLVELKKVTFFKDEHASNAWDLIFVTVVGMDIVDNFPQF